MISSLITSFVLTMIIELIIIKLFFFKSKVFKFVLLVNLLTNPLVVYIYNLLFIFGYIHRFTVLIILEILVFIIEGILYKLLIGTTLKKAIFASFIANLAAFLVGLLL